MHSKIRILFLISNFRKGGAETQFWNLVRGLDRSHYEVHVIQIQSKGRLAEPLGEAMTHGSSVYARCQLDPTVITTIVKYVKSSQIDIIQSLLFMDNQIARVVGLLTSCPVVTSVRGELLPILGRKKTYIEYKMQWLSTRIVTNSYWLKNELVKGGAKAKKVEVIHNGINTEGLQCDYSQAEAKKSLGINSDSIVIAVVARLHPMKDHLTFIRTIERLVKIDQKFVGLIIGSGLEEAHIKKLVADRCLGKNIIFAGEVKDGISEWYRALDVLLLTSVWGESFPNVIVEAMACRVPVIATDVSAVREIINDGENGFVVEKRDDKGFADRIMAILDDDKLKEQFIKRGLETVSQLDVQYMLSRYEKLYQSLA